MQIVRAPQLRDLASELIEPPWLLATTPRTGTQISAASSRRFTHFPQMKGALNSWPKSRRNHDETGVEVQRGRQRELEKAEVQQICELSIAPVHWLG
jgi:hypothetical protein